MIAYTLNKKFPAETRRPTAEKLLADYLRQKEQTQRLYPGAAGDIGILVSALFFEVMLNSYVDTYVYDGKRGTDYDEGQITRLIKIILLGINKYYEEQGK